MVGMAKIAVGPITCQHAVVNKWFQSLIPATLLTTKFRRYTRAGVRHRTLGYSNALKTEM